MFGLIIIFESRCILGELHLQRLSVTAATQTKQDIKPKKKKKSYYKGNCQIYCPGHKDYIFNFYE